MMKKLIFLFCLFGFIINTQCQVWRHSDGTLRNLNADLSLKLPYVPADTVYIINGQTFNIMPPVSPKRYRADDILGVRLINNRIIVKHTGYVNTKEWIGRIVWKEVYYVNNGNIELQGIVDGNYIPPQTINEQVTFGDE